MPQTTRQMFKECTGKKKNLNLPNNVFRVNVLFVLPFCAGSKPFDVRFAALNYEGL